MAAGREGSAQASGERIGTNPHGSTPNAFSERDTINQKSAANAASSKSLMEGTPGQDGSKPYTSSKEMSEVRESEMEYDGEQPTQNAADIEAQVPTERGLMKSETSVVYTDENVN